MVFPLAFLATAILGMIFLSGNIQMGIMVVIAIKPLIDATWNYSIAGINLLQIVGVMLPLVVLARNKSFSHVPLIGIWMTYVIYNMFTYSFTIFEGRVMMFIDSSFRILNGFVGYYMMQTYFSDKEAFRKLLLAFILGSLFPMLMGLFQAVTGYTWHERMAAGLVRNVGMYHDSQVFRTYGFQTITAIILYWSYFITPKIKFLFIKKILLLTLTGLCLLVLFKIYSKAAYMVGVLWFLIWIISRGQIRSLIFITIMALFLSLIFGNKISNEAQQVFSKETNFLETQEDDIHSEFNQKRTLGGRWYIWELAMNEYYNRSFLGQLFGNGISAAVHNDFLKTLLSGGIIGLLIYIILLIAIGIKIVNNYLKERSALNVMALMLFIMWLVDCTGLVPSLYPAYQWYVWGFIGLAFKGVKFQDKNKYNLPNKYNVIMKLKYNKLCHF
jgi:O-antigen ligase